MATITFDTHTYVKNLKAVGFTEEQAEAQAKALAEISDERLVIREYLDMRLALLEARLESKMKQYLIIIVSAIILSNAKIQELTPKFLKIPR
jgi:hypothetical protein